jgi:hypothetical protein
LLVEDCCDGPDGATMTQIFGYFRPDASDDETRDDADDALVTGDFLVPVRSPIAMIARQIDADPCGFLAHLVGVALCVNVAHCPCTPAAECPALNEISLLEAMENAIGPT